MDYYRFRPVLFREKTLHLDPYQDGCYRRLIDEYMVTRKPLPDNDNALARICGTSMLDPCFKHALSILRAFFRKKDGLLFHDYCDAELDWQDKTGKFRTEKAEKAAKARWNKNKDLDATSMQQAMLGDARDKSKDISTTEVVDNASANANLFPEENKNQPKEKSNGRKKPATARPTDWQPSFKNLELASSLGIDPELELGKFCDYHDAKGNKFADWDAAFRNWLRNASDYRARDAAREANRRQGPTSIVRAGLRAASMLREKP